MDAHLPEFRSKAYPSMQLVQIGPAKQVLQFAVTVDAATQSQFAMLKKLSYVWLDLGKIQHCKSCT